MPFSIAFTWSNGGLDKSAQIEQYYKKAIKLNPRYVEAKNNLARFYLSHSDEGFVTDPLNTALRLLNQADREALEQNVPIHDKILKNRAWANLQLEHFSTAKTDIDKSLKLDPQNAESHCINAFILEALEIEERAQAWLNCLQYGETDLGVMNNKSEWLELAREKYEQYMLKGELDEPQ